MEIKSLTKQLFVLVLLFLPFFASAQKGDPNLDSQNSHYLSISLSGGASGYSILPGYGKILLEDANFNDDTRPIALHPDSLELSAGPSATLGFAYEYQTARGFWFSLGVEAQILSGGLHHADSIYRIDRVLDGNIETGQEVADVEYTVINWQERQMNVLVNVPIMFGYKSLSGFYFGAGAKAGISLYNQINGDFGFADCNLYYERMEDILGIYKELPLTDVQSYDNNFVYVPQLSPIVEIGWQGGDVELSRRSKMRFKVALVGEMGVLSSYNNKNSAEQLFNYESLEGFRPEDLPDLFSSVNSFYSTIPLGLSKDKFNTLKNEGKFVNYAKSGTLSSWYVGVKFAIMFELPGKKWCNCLNNDVTRPWRKGRVDKGLE